jgi:predicted RNase H-like HicB family nuclease
VTSDYTAVFRHDAAGMWLVEIAEEPQVHTYGRSLIKARKNIHDAAALWFEIHPAALQLDEDLRLPGSIGTKVARAGKLREQAEVAQEKAAQATVAAARALVDDAQLTLRDAGAILGLSHQRVQQILEGDPRQAPPETRDPSAPARQRVRPKT